MKASVLKNALAFCFCLFRPVMKMLKSNRYIS